MALKTGKVKKKPYSKKSVKRVCKKQCRKPSNKGKEAKVRKLLKLAKSGKRKK
ncbi:hypothetical protein J4433_00985 [Candidatus Pacearchaeota archaeon]|nr:hypothetical protein [Candidatus Pacearchaeota archaeon]